MEEREPFDLRVELSFQQLRADIRADIGEITDIDDGLS